MPRGKAGGLRSFYTDVKNWNAAVNDSRISLYNRCMQPEVYRPILLSRRGEALAWLSTGLMFVGWAILLLRGLHVPNFAPYMTIFLLLASLSISLGNWMDRKSVIYLDDQGVEFINGLRHVTLTWAQVQQVEVTSSTWGNKVQVYGDLGHFSFRALGEVKAYGEVKGRMGFEQGDLIVEKIIMNAHLKEVAQDGNRLVYGRT